MEQQSSRASGSTSSKKIRMTMACERCRSKKVKCDFAHPSCSRCEQARANCSYDGSATQIDLFNLVKLNETVDKLQQRIQAMESDLKHTPHQDQRSVSPQEMQSIERNASTSTAASDRGNTLVGFQGSSNLSTAVTATSSATVFDTQWSLSLTPKGLRIDTNIISLQDLYAILSSGISRFAMNDNPHRRDHPFEFDTSSSHGSPSDATIDLTAIPRNMSLWKKRLKSFPMYNAWDPLGMPLISRPHGAPELLSKETLDQIMDIYSDCLLCLPCPEHNQRAVDRYRDGTIDPLLLNTMIAWTARHAAIYHDFFPGKDPNRVGEAYFKKAKELLKDRFTTTSIDTMHSLILLYIYSIGRSGDEIHSTESESYIYLGLAIRMCLSMKMHLESTSPDPIMREKQRRFFWAIYFLETLCTIHSDKPFSLPADELITVGFPSAMEHEQGEQKWRIEFIFQRFKITRIYHHIIQKTAKDTLSFSTITALDKELQQWYDELPPYFQYTPEDMHTRKWDTMSFREQACIKLNAEYQFQLCQLYGLFVSKSPNMEPASAVNLLAQKACVSASDTIVDLLHCWSKLGQSWCHFSLETLMMTIVVYGNLLEQSPQEQLWAKKQLACIANVLKNSPVRHHKYVITLVTKIEGMLAGEPVADNHPISPTEPTIHANTATHTPHHSNVRMSTSCNVSHQHADTLNMTPEPTHSLMAATMLETNINKGVSAVDATPFSNFVYEPNVMGYNARQAAASGLINVSPALSQGPSSLPNEHGSVYSGHPGEAPMSVPYPHLFASSPAMSTSYSAPSSVMHHWHTPGGLQPPTHPSTSMLSSSHLYGYATPHDKYGLPDTTHGYINDITMTHLPPPNDQLPMDDPHPDFTYYR